jgi:hypothetical protein
MTVADFNVNLRRVMPDAPYCLDHTATFYAGRPWTAHLDILKLERWLIARHGAYRGSMRDRIMELFGAEALAFVIDAIGPKKDEKICGQDSPFGDIEPSKTTNQQPKGKHDKQD